MEFILQLLADMFAPIEEQDATITPVQEADSTEVGAILTTVQSEEANIFNFVEFH